MAVVPLRNTLHSSGLNSLAVRSEFPIFKQQHNKPFYYLDNAATTHKPQPVIDAITESMTTCHAPINRGFYAMAEEATTAYENARARLANFIAAPQTKSLVFTASVTDSINLIANGFLKKRLKPGDIVWTTRMEHHANYLPWLQVCSETDAELRIIELTAEGELDLENARGLFGEKSALIAVTHTSNVLGTQNDVKQICEKARLKNIPVLVDAAQAMVSNQVNVTDLDCAFFTFSAHKMFGPTGIGALYIAPDYLEQVEPFRLGGGMVDFVTDDIATTQWTEVPQRLEAGSPNYSGALGFAAACDYIRQFKHEDIKAHLYELTTMLCDYLTAFDDVVVVTPDAHLSSGIVSLYHREIHGHDLAQILGDEGVAVRAGHHCAQPLLDYLNTSSTLRVSFSIYNDSRDVLAVVMALRKAEELFA